MFIIICIGLCYSKKIYIGNAHNTIATVHDDVVAHTNTHINNTKKPGMKSTTLTAGCLTQTDSYVLNEKLNSIYSLG